MDLHRAVGIVEGFESYSTEEEWIEAWQLLHDTGTAYQLQGWYGRTAREMIRQGIIQG
jgi:hypothetical protein